MYASTDFPTKKAFRAAVRRGEPIVLYSPELGMPAVNGKATVEGPWPGLTATPEPFVFGPLTRRQPKALLGWQARVTVRDMRVVTVH